MNIDSSYIYSLWTLGNDAALFRLEEVNDDPVHKYKFKILKSKSGTFLNDFFYATDKDLEMLTLMLNEEYQPIKDYQTRLESVE